MYESSRVGIATLQNRLFRGSGGNDMGEGLDPFIAATLRYTDLDLSRGRHCFLFRQLPNGSFPHPVAVFLASCEIG